MLDQPPQKRTQDESYLLGLTKGLMTFRTANTSLIVPTGLILYIPPHTDFKMDCFNRRTIGWQVSCSTEWIPHGLHELRVVKPTILLDALCQEILSWQNFDNNSIEKLRVIGVFFDKFKQCEPLQGMNVPLPKLPKLWSVATKILESPDDKRSIDDWSKSVGMGRRSFTKYFAQETGLSFAVWRQKVKLQTALVCLSQGLPVKEVAARLNYSPSAFIEVFRRQFGQPPKQYTSTLLSENKQQTPIRNTTLSKN